MNPKIILVEEGAAWSWSVVFGSERLGGGYGKTKADALNDAAIFGRCFPALEVAAKDAESLIGSEPDAVAVILAHTSNGQSMERIGYYEVLSDGSFYCICYNDDHVSKDEAKIRQWLIDHV